MVVGVIDFSAAWMLNAVADVTAVEVAVVIVVSLPFWHTIHLNLPNL